MMNFRQIVGRTKMSSKCVDRNVWTVHASYLKRTASSRLFFCSTIVSYLSSVNGNFVGEQSLQIPVEAALMHIKLETNPI